MPPDFKRKSCVKLNSLQENVLSAFSWSYCRSDSSSRTPKRSKRDPFCTVLTQHSSLKDLCDDLCCVSNDAGTSRLLDLKQKLQKRSHTSSELAAQLFTCDEVDTSPPLCVAVHLLEGRHLLLKEVDPSAIIHRAVLELRQPEICQCRGQRNGVQALIQLILGEGYSSERDIMIQRFLAILVQDGNAASPTSHKKERFRLAEHLLVALRDAQAHLGEDIYTLQALIRQAAVPTRVTNKDHDNSTPDIWTPELSGLATGRSPAEYLSHRKTEERALTSLFKVLPPSNAAKMYLECIHSVTGNANISSGSPPRANGCWSRVVILGHRVLDVKTAVDADPDLGRGIISSLNGVLTAAISSNNLQEIGILVCLFRCLFLPRGNLEEDPATFKCLKDYETWLRDFVAKITGNMLLSLLNPLTELVPLEPLKLLRVNHRVLSSKREHMRLASDYLISLRARISDLDPERPGRSLSSNRGAVGAGPNLDVSGRLEDEVMEYVFDYAKLEKIPSSLVRKMNFHRYYFRTQILTCLLHPHLSDKIGEKSFNQQRMNPRAFDECRINMIKELAFNRKDKAVTVTEATEAIACIHRGRQENAPATASKLRKDNANDCVLSESSSLRDICQAILDECEVTPNARDLNHSSSHISLLIQKIENERVSKREHVRGPELAAELLQSVTRALEEKGKSNYPEIFAHLFVNTSAESALKVYADWWYSFGVGLLKAIRQLLESAIGREIQKFLQYQIFALLCTNESCISRGTIISLAMITTGLTKATGDPILEDILTVSKDSRQGPFIDFLSTVVTCLPLKHAAAVRTSVTFALHCICLHVTFLDNSCSSRHENKAAKNNISPDGKPPMSFSASSVYRSLLDLLRWIVCHPWRLSPLAAIEFSPSDARKPQDSIFVINFAIRLLVSHRIPISHDFSIEEYLQIEERCGWGRPGPVYEALKSRETRGDDPAGLLSHSALFLAKRSSSGWPSVGWIERGIMRYAEERTLCFGLKHAKGATLSDAPRILEHCGNSDGTIVGYRLFDIYSRMRLCYFHGYSGVAIQQHVATILIPCYWPFSCHMVNYLWDCMDNNCSSWQSGESGIKNNFLLLSNFASYSSLRRNKMMDMNGHSGESVATHSDILTSRTMELSKALQEVLGFGGDKDNMLGTQVLTRSVTQPLLPATLARAFGSCVVLELAKKCLVWGENRRGERLRSCLRQMTSVVDASSVLELFDSSLSVASLLPFSSLAKEHDQADEITAVTDEVIRELLERYVELLAEGARPFDWTRRPLQDIFVSDDTMPQNVLIWLGQDGDGGQITRQRNVAQFAIDVCMGRVFQSLGSLSDRSMSYLISSAGQHGLSNGLVPNILNICKRLRSCGCLVGDIKLSTESYGKLLESKEVLKGAMIMVAIRLLRAAKEMFPGFEEEAVGEVIANFSEFSTEVRSGVMAQATVHEETSSNCKRIGMGELN